MILQDLIELLSKKVGDKFVSRVNDTNFDIEELLTDSRNNFNPEKSLFFAIHTPGGNDGHKFITPLYDRGVRNFVVEYLPDEISKLEDGNFFIVPDSIEALREIGKSHRFRAKEIVAITGSRGKTTLKEMIFQLMEPLKLISRSPRSFNSKIGVPLSLWQISNKTDIALIETGISKKDEMLQQVQTIEPHTVIFTNIGEAHSGGFSSLKEKTAEKALLASGKSVKDVIYCKDNSLLDEIIKNIINKEDQGKNLIRWSIKDRDVELFIELKGNQLNYVWDKKTYSFKVVPEKEYDLENIAGALAFMLKEEVDHKIIQERFRNLSRIKTRLNVSDGVNGCSLIIDSYTSDLSSLLPAIDFMARRKRPDQTSTLIISDLHHEGADQEETYRGMSKIVQQTGIEKFIGIGKNLSEHRSLFPVNSEFYETTQEFLKQLTASDFNDEIILLKGSGEFNFEKILERLESKKHETVLEVNLDAIQRNYNYFRSHLPSTTGVIAMVKASGYGAGSYEIAKTLQDAGASYLAVAALDEGIDLRHNGITMPIMVMNPRAANYRALFNHRLQPVIYSMSMLNDLRKQAKKYGVGEYPVHIKLDTGMHRMGFLPDELEELKSILCSLQNIKVASIFSHLATADCLDMDKYTLRQLQRFEDMSSEIMKVLSYHVDRHILNSAGILRFPQYHYDLVRLGIGLYGANTLPPEIEKPLSPVSTLRSVIINIREIEGPQEGNLESDEAVGYSRNGKINRRSRIATIPIGYADGMNRKFGNGNVKLWIDGHLVPTIGNICMDATMLDVTDVYCKEGDSVEIFGENISVQALADTLDTIPYEVLTSISPRVKRIYYRE